MPIVVTDDGMVTEVREEQSAKARTPISVTPSGTVAWPSTMTIVKPNLLHVFVPVNATLM